MNVSGTDKACMFAIFILLLAVLAINLLLLFGTRGRELPGCLHVLERKVK